MALSNNDQQKLFESYLKINEDVGLGPARKGDKVMNVTSIGSSGKPGNSHMDISKSNLTPMSENEEIENYKGSVDEIVDNIISDLEFIKTEKPILKSTNRKLLLKQIQREVERIKYIISKGEIQKL